MYPADEDPTNPFSTGIPGAASASRENGDRLSAVERRILETGKKSHRETTASARRALQIAETTAEMANNTLVEVHRQGQVLQKADYGVATMESDVKEASRLMKFMQRWCCFQIICCCDCFDPDVQMDRTRNQRVRQRQLDQAALDDVLQMEHVARHGEIKRLASKRDPGYNGDEGAARSELFAADIRRKSSNNALRLGHGLPEDDLEEIEGETQQQDRYLDRIGTTVESLKIMSLELQGELQSQEPVIESLGERTFTTQQSLRQLARRTRKI